jgi:galactokinase
MAKQDQATAIAPAELLRLVEEMRVAQLHISNLLSFVEKEPLDEMGSVVTALRHYVQEDYEAWRKIDEIANALVAKGGAQ